MKKQTGFYALYDKFDGSFTGATKVMSDKDAYKSNKDLKLQFWELITQDISIIFSCEFPEIPPKALSWNSEMAKEIDDDLYECDICWKFSEEHEMWAIENSDNDFSVCKPCMKIYEEVGAWRYRTKDDFWNGTVADWREISDFNLSQKADFVSRTGDGEVASKYYFFEDKVIRVADHWGNVQNCYWTLDGVSDITGSIHVAECFYNKFKTNNKSPRS